VNDEIVNNSTVPTSYPDSDVQSVRIGKQLFHQRSETTDLKATSGENTFDESSIEVDKVKLQANGGSQTNEDKEEENVGIDEFLKHQDEQLRQAFLETSSSFSQVGDVESDDTSDENESIGIDEFLRRQDEELTQALLETSAVNEVIL